MMKFFLSFWLAFFSGMVWAQEIGLAGILGKKAILVVDGANPQSAAVGESVRGFQVIEVREKEVVVERKGRKITLRVGQNASSKAKEYAPSAVTLQADAQGHYFVDAQVEGRSVRLMVDTGASAVIFGASAARQLNLDVSQAQKGFAQTGNGKVETQIIRLKSLTLGPIELNDVEAYILSGESPHSLLGMSALRHLNMQQSGSSMTLSVR